MRSSHYARSAFVGNRDRAFLFTGQVDLPKRWKHRPWLRSLLFALGLAIVLLSMLAELAHAGGPAYVAGVSVFNSGMQGTPLTWAQGAISYYTDQGDLSPLLPGLSADAFVADAFSRWTSIPTAAISITHAGQLAEDVSGANVTANGNGTISMPSDIMPTATGQPVAIVYDMDGSVTDALLGEGASSECFTYAVFGGIDNFSADALLLHAMIVLNGSCAQTPSQLPDVKYRLVRVLGRVLGLDWSQVNLNVLTGQPRPTAADYAGFPVMHAVDPTGCVPISICYSSSDPTQPKMDDQAALSRLYPVTAQNQVNFPGQQIFSMNTVRIHGSVYFVDGGGLAAQPMQGVNVVARWVDPSGTPSRTYAAASVSGFLFCGNAGNPVTGLNDSTGQPYNRFGSSDTTVEGFFDLAGLQIPDDSNSATFELTVEAADPVWSYGMGPYGTMQVARSGNARLFVAATQGQDVAQDILMTGSSMYVPNWFGATSYDSPATVPAAGDWLGALSPYADVDYFAFPAQANRTFSISVTALDESGNASENQAQPVIGLWTLAEPETSPAPGNTPSAFNTFNSGETRLDVGLNVTTSLRMAVADIRGDGRPDFQYHAHVFYGDSVTPVRASAGGGTPLSVQGLGFRQGDTVNISNGNASLLAVSANQLLAAAPAVPDGVQSIMLSDPATGGSSTMTSVLTFGAGPSDTINLISGAGQKAPPGGQAPLPVVVQVVAPDGITPVAGASVFFVSSPAASLSACSGGASCTLLSDQSGHAYTYVTVLMAATITITAELAPVSYNPPAQVQAVVSGIASSMNIALAPQLAWIAKGATVALPLTARVLSSTGVPIAERTVDFQVLKGLGLLTSLSVTTNANGYATSTLELSALAGDVLVSACIGPADVPCLNFAATAVPTSSLQLEPVAGSLQVATVGQNFQPVTVQVTDSASPPHPVLGASVAFQSIVARAPQDFPVVWLGDTVISSNPMPVILSSSQSVAQSDANGMATITPSTSGVQGPVLVLGTAGVGNNSLPLQFTLQSLPPVPQPAPTSESEARQKGGER